VEGLTWWLVPCNEACGGLVLLPSSVVDLYHVDEFSRRMQ
jgi:hypothetical protein